MRWLSLPTLGLLASLAACDAATDLPAPIAPGDGPAHATAAAAAVALASEDANGNGLVCVSQVTGRNGPQTIVTDDRGGRCPAGSVLTEVAPTRTVAAGSSHACALDESGAAWCWGSNGSGELGVPDLVPSLTPVAVQGAPPLVAITAGTRFTCGLDENGAAWCWGSNGVGQLGIGDAGVISTPVPSPVTGGLAFATLDAGERYACGTEADGRLHCWGDNQQGELGATTTDVCSTGASCSPAPVPAADGLLFESFDAGLSNSCGVATDGVTYCWGWDALHQGGDGIIATGPTPTPVAAPVPFVDVVAGSLGGCALDEAGGAWCWGDLLANGALGHGLQAGSTTPVAVVGGHVFETLASSDANYIFWFQCGLDDGAAAWCWGSHFDGQLGTDDDMDACNPFAGQPHPCSYEPVAVEGDLTWSELDLGRGFACGRSTGGDVYCWGNNAAGTLGDGTTTSRPLPAPVAFGAASAVIADSPPAGTPPVDARIMKD